MGTGPVLIGLKGGLWISLSTKRFVHNVSFTSYRLGRTTSTQHTFIYHQMCHITTGKQHIAVHEEYIPCLDMDALAVVPLIPEGCGPTGPALYRGRCKEGRAVVVRCWEGGRRSSSASSVVVVPRGVLNTVHGLISNDIDWCNFLLPALHHSWLLVFGKSSSRQRTFFPSWWYSF